MITKRSSEQRGQANHGWLRTYHTFSFGGYHDPGNMGFRRLRVINEDWVQGGGGFPTHPHQNMEILTWVLEGALEHKDNTGGGGVIKPGIMQHMTAGSGITHSEFNPSATETTHLYQIWLFPRAKDLTPSYRDMQFDPAERQGRFQVLASPQENDNSLTIQQDATLSVAELQAGQSITQPTREDRYSWIQVTAGSLLLNDELYTAGDGAALTKEAGFTLKATEQSQALWFDLN